MSSIKELEEKLKKQSTQKNLLETLSSYFNIWLNELKKTVWNLLSTPSKWENQISKHLEKWEEKLRNQF